MRTINIVDNKYTKVPKPAQMDIVTDTEDKEGTEGTENAEAADHAKDDDTEVFVTAKRNTDDDTSASGPEKLNPNDMHDLVYRTYSLGKVF